MTARHPLFHHVMKRRFSICLGAADVTAILEGRKNQHRFIVRPQPEDITGTAGYGRSYVVAWQQDAEQNENKWLRCPYGVPGDKLWVKEEWAEPANDGVPYYKASFTGAYPPSWRPAVFMPRRFCRITLQISDVDLTRLHLITEEDAQAEGVERDTSPCDHQRRSCEEVGCMGQTFRAAFCEKWSRQHGTKSWLANPWVWVLSFSG